MRSTRGDFDLVKDAIRIAIAEGRQTQTIATDLNEEELIRACGRLSIDSSPAVLQALGNFTLLCLVRADLASLKTHREIRKMMNS